MNPSGWRSRDYLPHLDDPTKIQLLTIRLADSMPQSIIARIQEELKSIPEAQRPSEYRRRIEKWLDAGYGNCWLRMPEIAALVEETLLAGHAQTYTLFEWTIMPNHVHLLARMEESTSLSEFFKSLKGTTSRLCNRHLGRGGAFWYREYHDRFIRDENHYTNAVSYIHQNAVKAGLCAEPWDWPFASARFRTREVDESSGAE